MVVEVDAVQRKGQGCSEVSRGPARRHNRKGGGGGMGGGGVCAGWCFRRQSRSLLWLRVLPAFVSSILVSLSNPSMVLKGAWVMLMSVCPLS